MIDKLFINNTYIPLSKSINASITNSITDVSDPSKRKASFSKTATIPGSKEANELFGHIFELNLEDGTFNPMLKADCLYIVDGIEIINGYCQLKDIVQIDHFKFDFKIVMYGTLSSIFKDFGEKFLSDLDMSYWNHPLNNQIIVYSWDDQVYADGEPGFFLPFQLGRGYVYPLIDYGYSTDSTEFKVIELAPAFYVKEYIDTMFREAGKTYTSTFFESEYFRRLIIPSSPSSFQLNKDDILVREFSSNTPKLASTNSTTSNILAKAYDVNTQPFDQIIFTNELDDPGFNYDPITGIFTAVYSGVYDFNALLDIKADFIPNDLAANCKTATEAKIEVSILKNGGFVGSELIWITCDDSTSFAGTRSSSTPPIPGKNDYLNTETYSSATTLYNATTKTSRAVNPANRYLITASDVNITAGDEITVVWRGVNPGFNGYSGVHQRQFFVVNTFGIDFFLDGEARIKIEVGAFYNKVKNEFTAENDLLLVNKTIPKKIKQKDFFTSIVKMFNLMVDVNPDKESDFIIEPRDDYFGSDVKDISGLMAQDKPINIKPIGIQDAQNYLFQYKEDSDYYNEKYKSEWAEIYGQREVIIENDFTSKENKTQLIFSPTPSVALPGSNRVIPTIIKQSNTGEPVETKHNIRILIYGGLKPTLDAWTLAFNYPSPAFQNYTEYPYSGHFNDPFNATEDINFGLVKEVYYDDDITPINITNNNLYNRFYSKYIREITDRNSKLVTAYVHLTPYEYKEFTFNKLYYFENSYFRLQKISGYNPTNESLTKCDFLKIKEVVNFNGQDIPIYGNDGGFDWVDPGVDPGGSVDEKEILSVLKSRTNRPDGNNARNRSITIKGKDNIVSNKSKNIDIIGDKNKIFGRSQKVTIKGNNNIIIGENVVLMNCNGMTVYESNVTFINNKRANPDAIEDPTRVEQIDSNTVVSELVKTYEVDTSTGDVDLTFNLTTETYTEGRVWHVKKMDLANNLNIIVNGGTIEGVASITLTALWESVSIQYDGTNFIII